MLDLFNQSMQVIITKLMMKFNIEKELLFRDQLKMEKALGLMLDYQKNY